MKELHSSEIDPDTKYPVIDLMPDQKDIEDIGGTMRLGVYPCKLNEDTNAYEAYKDELYMKDIDIDMNLIMNLEKNN